MPLDFDLLFSPSNVSMFENDGLKSLLIKMEDGESGEIGYNSDLEFPEATCRIRAIKDSYSAICKKIQALEFLKNLVMMKGGIIYLNKLQSMVRWNLFLMLMILKKI